jgi:hypothetical protein
LMFGLNYIIGKSKIPWHIKKAAQIVEQLLLLNILIQIISDK